MSNAPANLRQLLADEIARRLPRLRVDEPDPNQVRVVLHALKGSAAMAGEQELSLVIGQVGAGVRAGRLELIAQAERLLSDVLARLRAGQGAFRAAWPEPPPMLLPSQPDARFSAEYSAGIRDRLAELDDALSAGDPLDALDRVRRCVHAIKGAAGSVGDDVIAWYCHGLESHLSAGRGDDPVATLRELGRHRGILAALLERPADALRTLRGDDPNARNEPTRPSSDPTGTEEPEAFLRIRSSALDHLLERLERLYLVQDELRTAVQVAADLERRLQLSAHSTGDDAVAAATRISEVTRRSSAALQASVAEMRLELGSLRRTTMGWLFDRAAVATRRLADLYDRPVRITTSGVDVPVDRRLAEQLLEPVLQLARNAVAHGLQASRERADSGRPPRATVGFHAQLLGDWLRLVVQDDGRGVDEARVRQLVVERGAIDPATAANAGLDQLLGLLFLPGLTTRDESDLIAGRGMGLQLARDAVRALGGALRLSSAGGTGLTATIEVPSQSGLVDVVWIQSGDWECALPAGFVGSVRPTTEGEKVIPLGACLGHPPGHTPRLALELRLHGVDPIQLGVDSVGKSEEACLRPLPGLIAASGPFAGAILRSDGSLRMCLDPALVAARAWWRAADC